MEDVKQREAAKEFYLKWDGKGNEDEDYNSYWIEILSRILGVEDATDHIQFQKKVHLKDGSTKRIDAYIPETKVLIEQKSFGIDLDKPYIRSGVKMENAFDQANKYNNGLINSEKARWIVTSNFSEIWIYDMDKEESIRQPVKLMLSELPENYHMLDFLINQQTITVSKEIQVSKDAGEIISQIYDAFLKQYKDPTDAHNLHSLNVLCVRLVFCLYAENAGVFGRYGIFHDYLESYSTQKMRKALEDLFHVLDTPETERDEFLADDDPLLASFPYVNGGLFSDEDITIPPFTEEIRTLLLDKASAGFNWSEISPTIFGAVFESTLNPETRRSGGMHYTSIENIHKVIDPLFLDDLKKEFADICKISVEKTKQTKLQAFQKKLSSLTFLDPACGSGNFLTEAYLCLRRLENDVLRELSHGQMSFGDETMSPIRVTLGQFYGIEINDFAVTVAKTALWIAESQMMKETESIVLMHLDFLPLKSYTNIVEGNALRIDWEDVVPKDKLNYIMGNPPFVGYSLQTKEQKDDIRSIYVDEKGIPYKTAGKIDYVSGWYFKAAELIQGTTVQTAFVSTNSITQGEQVSSVWKPLYDRFGIHIDFAYRTFIWDSEASLKAQVHCVIVGFSSYTNTLKPKRIFDEDRGYIVKNINAYLMDAPDVFISSRKLPICNVPQMVYGNKPADGGFLFLSAEEYSEVIKKEPDIDKYIRQIYGATEYINNKKRYCLWLVDASPTDIKNSSFIKSRIEKVRQFRLSSNKEATRKSADESMLFQEIRQPDSEYIIVPRHSSENRRYIPFGFVNPKIIVNDAVQIIPNATLYHFGVLTSNVHMAWTRAVCGRIKSDYRYSKDVVYNNFLWPDPIPEQRERIEQTAQGILDARALYPDSSLADLYDELTMPPELRKAHQENDKAVMAAYGWTKKDEAFNSEAACVAELMKMYQKLVEEKHR